MQSGPLRADASDSGSDRSLTRVAVREIPDGIVASYGQRYSEQEREGGSRFPCDNSQLRSPP
jgi:hypothetical protein